MVSRFFPLILLGTLLGACAASDEDLNEEFDEFVAERVHCESTDQCMRSGYGCPLGCTTVFNKKYEAEIDEKAEELISRYEFWGARCDYNCGEAGQIACVENSCTEAHKN